MRWWAFILGCLLACTAEARVAVVSEVSAAAGYLSGEEPSLVNRRALRAVTTVLDRYGATYDVIPKSQALTHFCRTGIFYRVTSGYNYDSTVTLGTYDAVIHVGFNGSIASSPATPYRPDSLTINIRHVPKVPQLFLMDDELPIAVTTVFDNGTSDSTWLAVNGAQTSGGGTGNHEGEGTVYTPDNDFRWFDTTYGSHMLKKSGQPNGGMRVLLAGGANATFTNLNLTGNMPLFVDSLSTAVTDTMKVWERLNQFTNPPDSYSGIARLVFATVLSGLSADSASTAGLGNVNTYDSQGVNWPVLMFAMAHLDSLSGGEVFGDSVETSGLSRKKVIRWGAVITGAGTTSDRRHPGGFFLADSSIVAASCDSLGTLNLPLVVAADPESLIARPWQVAIFNRIKTNKWAPWVRVGLDSAVAGNGNAAADRPVDVWGRYRNRTVYGGSFSAGIVGADSSIAAGLTNARSLLRAQVGAERLSKALIAPDFDWSPYQMRAHQNTRLLDSLLWLSSRWNGPLIVNVQDRDRDPAYLRTNPRGWRIDEGYHSTAISGRVAVLGANGFTVRGSRVAEHTDGLSFVKVTEDSTAPYLSADPGPNASVVQESKFWNGLFGPSRDYLFESYDNIGSTDEGVYINTKDRLYGSPSKASVIVLPAQSLGGQDINGPNRWGFFVLKHLVHATRAINAKAGRTLIAPAYPEDIDP